MAFTILSIVFAKLFFCCFDLVSRTRLFCEVLQILILQKFYKLLLYYKSSIIIELWNIIVCSNKF